MTNKFKLGIAFGGGGARGIAHLGCWKALLENDLEPNIIAGTSAGALVGAFLCAGESPENILNLFSEKGIFDFVKVRIPRKGLLELQGLEDFLNAELGIKRIEDLPKPLIITASELTTAKVFYFQEGPLAKLLTASSCLPVLFAPVEIDGLMFVDGGLFDNIPVQPLESLCRSIIACNATPIGESNQLNNLVDITQRIFELAANHCHSSAKAWLQIEYSALCGKPLLDTRYAADAFKVGYEATITALKSARIPH